MPAEYGVIIPRGVSNVYKRLPALFDRNADNALSELFKELSERHYQKLEELQEHLDFYTKKIQELSKTKECKQLQEIPGIGSITASAFYQHVGNGSDFKNGRCVSASAGLVSRQHSSGGKDKLLGISKGRCDLNFTAIGDFICDALEWWWDLVKNEYPEVEELVIFSDNGSENSGCRTQYLFRLKQFSERSRLRIHNVYYPPYHSKYNPVERVWSSLEKHWNGTLLSSVNTVLEWTKTMTWKAMTPVVNLIDKVYSKGVQLTKNEKEDVEGKIIRNCELPKWGGRSKFCVSLNSKFLIRYPICLQNGLQIVTMLASNFGLALSTF